MSTFGHYFVAGLLRHMGWPRKLGFFRGEGYDTFIVDEAIAQMVDWAATLGAARPPIALSMIAEMFRDRDWDSDNAPHIATFVAEVRSRWEQIPNASPRDIAPPITLRDHGKVVSGKQFGDPRLSSMLEFVVLKALLWGLTNPARVLDWYAQKRESYDASLPEMRKSGLDVDELPGFQQSASQCEEVIRLYELDMGALASPHPKLLADAAVLGVKLG